MDQDDRRKLKALRGQIVQKIKVQTLLPKLLQNKVFNEDDCNLPKWTKNLDDIETAASVYDAIKTRGPFAFENFILSLKQSCHEELADLLKSYRLDNEKINVSCNNGNLPSKDSKLDSTSYIDDYYKEMRKVDEPLVVKVRKAEKFLDDPEIQSIQRYCMRSNPRGLVLIINNVNFIDGRFRFGADVDEKNARILFEDMGFKVISHRNLSGIVMKQKVQEFAQMKELQNVHSCFVLISSHGDEDEDKNFTEIHGIDYQEATYTKFHIEDVIQCFEASKCPYLVAKPKILIFQTCRGKKTQPSIRTSTDGVSMASLNCVESPAQTNTLSFEHCDFVRNCQDILIAYATMPGYVSYRDTKNGSWFIQILIEVFMNHAWETHVQDLFLIVDDRLRTHKDGGNCQTVKTENIGFNKHCFINPGLF